jgi:UDP-N-acetylglucosamine 2-epimerase
VQKFVAGSATTRFMPTLGSKLYFSALTHMDAMVGNSSSGLYEGPSFGISTVNIGDRQKGRLRASSVIDCAGERRAIAAAIVSALARGRKPSANPYGDGHTAERILAVLASIGDPRDLLVKRFVELEAA